MYNPTIGLEIHIELGTKTKMFCSCKNDSEETKPNTNVCPICLAHPGTLPVPNKEAIKSVIKVGLALGGKISKKSYFSRKSYFYPDIPKGYQISQYHDPLVEGGKLLGVRIKRIHIEEDTGSLTHTNDKVSYVDYNRAGVPLMELVTEPDINNAETAVTFARELQLILRYLNISRADMEKGEMRIEANISISKNTELGTKVEIKNINSFKAVEGAIRYEIQRQKEVLESNKKISQETRGWNDKNMKTESQRSKESAHDYRYFEEPDIPPIEITPKEIEAWRGELGELPEEKRKRLEKEFKLSKSQAELLAEDESLSSFFEDTVSELARKTKAPNIPLVMNYLTSDLKGLMNEKGISISDIKISREEFAHLIFLIQNETVSSRIAKDLLQKMFETGEDPETLLRESGAMVSDESELESVIKTVIEKNPDIILDYKKGKENALQALIGKVMMETKGKANPQKLRGLIQSVLTKN